MRLLIDGDVLAYRTAAAYERPYDWGDDEWTLHTDAREVYQAMDDMLAELPEFLTERGYIIQETRVYLTDRTSTNFRVDLNPEYKANRKGQRKPIGLNAAVEYLRTVHGATSLPRLEADDCLAMDASKTPGEAIIASVDKDFRQVAQAFVVNPWDDVPEVEFMEPDAAEEFFLTQVLMGDRVDGYSGVPRVGPVTAEKLLAKHGVCWDTVVEAYEKAGMTEVDAISTARMAHLLRDGEYDEDDRTVKLWTPSYLHR